MREKMTLKEAVLQAEPHRMMRGDSGRYPDGTCGGQTSSVDGFWLPLEAWQAITAHLTQPAQAVDVEPDPALLASMATCLHHGFGLLDARQQQSMLHDMRKVWDEVMGRGYYRPENRDRYMAYVHPAALPNANGKEG